MAFAPYWRSIARGAPWSMPIWCWAMAPESVRRWLSYRVLEPANERARNTLLDNHLLADVCRDRFTAYTLPAASVLFLWEMLQRLSPTRIIECGSGISTAVFASYARQQELMGRTGVSVASLEHDPQWATGSRTMLVEAGLAAYAHVIDAPMVNRTFSGLANRAYQIPAELLSELAGAGFDFCLIDGPPANSIGRLGAFLVIKDLLAVDATVLLDDAMRPHELECWTRWYQLTRRGLSAGRFLLVPHGMLVGKWKPEACNHAHAPCPRSQS